MMETLTIGQRAAKAVRQRAPRKMLAQEIKRIHSSHASYGQWKCGKTNPSPYVLARMAVLGYDIYWILTGQESGVTGEDRK